MINTPGPADKEILDGLEIRRAAVERGIPCITSIDTARAMVAAMATANAVYTVQPLPTLPANGIRILISARRIQRRTVHEGANEVSLRAARPGPDRAHHGSCRTSAATRIFVVSALAMVPLAAVLGRQPKKCHLHRSQDRRLAERDARQRGRADHHDRRAARRTDEVVKASIAGSIIGNILIVLGALVRCSAG